MGRYPTSNLEIWHFGAILSSQTLQESINTLETIPPILVQVSHSPTDQQIIEAQEILGCFARMTVYVGSAFQNEVFIIEKITKI